MCSNKKHSQTLIKLYSYILNIQSINELSTSVILSNTERLPETTALRYFDLQPEIIALHTASFEINSDYSEAVYVSVVQEEHHLGLNCSCSSLHAKLCEHLVRVLYTLTTKPDLRIFLDDSLRKEKLAAFALDYGLENESDLDIYFEISYKNRRLSIEPKLPELIPFNAESIHVYKNQLILPVSKTFSGLDTETELNLVLIISHTKFSDHFQLALYEAHRTKRNTIKNPLTSVNPLDVIWKMNDTNVLKFYSAVAKFQSKHRDKKTETDMEGLIAVVNNPLELSCYYHDAAISEKIHANSVLPVTLKRSAADLHIQVDQKGAFYMVSGRLLLDGLSLDLERIKLKYDYFIVHNTVLHLIENPAYLKIIGFFCRHTQKIIIHESKFEEFRQGILLPLENNVRITYSFLRPATPVQLTESGFNGVNPKLIYLEDFGNYVMLTPVIKYGNVEVPVFSKKQIYSVDSHGHPFTVARNEELEIQFIADLTLRHPEFKEQLESGREFFHLHKKEFLNEEWFPDTFEAWHEQQIQVFGFNKLTRNKLNPNKAKVSVQVNSGINWFDTTINVHFGKQKVSLKHLHKAVKNKSKYITLDDGSSGILPSEWIEKFTRYFESGEIAGETIRTPKINFAGIEEMYEAEALTLEVRDQINLYKSRISSFQAVGQVKVPDALQASLRHYQQEGLNWLNFLDDFEFGGCLADDMGLGKTIQIIAFILSQRNKHAFNTNLIIVPTSLIHNWQSEVEKFAPTIKLLTIYGAGRAKEVHGFDDYEIILTSYGTLLNDVNFLKKYRFNYIILDESQAIKNPDSQRYKAARLLQARNRIVVTGTPLENNTFDLYGQLSFACPGLLGTPTQFKNYFSVPIDRFQDHERAKELQKKINPFLLRRTKKQVASELPDKTEMVMYCEMGEEQRKVYHAYESEFYAYLNSSTEIDIPRQSLHVLQGLTKLRQICNSPALLNDSLYYGNASAKIDILLEQIETKSPTHKILVFSQFVTMLDLIREELRSRNIAFEYLTGQTRDRAARVANFQNNADIRVFLVSLKAGGTGLNLTEADYVYIVDPWWNPAVENQAIDRSYRIGQKKNVIAVRLICPDTLEEKIMKLQDSKRDLAQDLVRTDAAILKSLSRNDLLNLIS